MQRSLAAAGALAVVAAAAMAPPSVTLASFTDAESVRADFTALTMPAPASASCTTVQLFLRTGAKVSWTPPTGGLPTGAQYELRVTNVSATPNVSRSIPTTATTLTLEDGLLSGGLLGGLLSGNASLRFDVITVLSLAAAPPTTAWRSIPTPVPPIPGAYTGSLLSGSFSC